MTCHSELRDGVVDLSGKYFTSPFSPHVSENPSYTQVVMCGRESPRYTGQQPTIHQNVSTIRIRRYTSWSVIYGIEGRTAFIRCVSWIMTPSLTRKIGQRNFAWLQKMRNMEIARGLPPEVPSLLPFCRLIRWPPWCRVGGNNKKLIQKHHDQTEAALLKDLRKLQDQGSDHDVPRDLPPHPGLSVSRM